MKRHPLHRSYFTIAGNKNSALETARGRIAVISFAFIMIYLVVGVRLFDVMIIQGAFGPQETAQQQLIDGTTTDKKRADIKDRNGVLLATSIKTASLFADPALIVDPQNTAKALAALFPDESYDALYQKLQKKGRFVWLRRNLIPEEQAAILRIGDPGLAFKKAYKRVYPQGELSAHIVGYSNVDGKGLAGLERAFDKSLGTHGETIHASIDIRVQHALRQEIKNTIDKFSAKAGAGIVMNAKTGEVLSLVSLPDFDPHNPMHPEKPEMFNRASLGVYELGSVFKIFSTAALIDSHENPLSLTFDAREPLKRGRHTIRDFHAEDRILTLPEVFMVSSNIGTALMGEMIGAEAMQKFYTDLGLMTKPEVSLMEIGSPLYPRPWRDISTLTASYGHGIAVSPLQLTQAVATIVNDGVSVQPQFLKTPNDTLPHSGERIISSETSKIMRGLMGLVVTDGTARKAAVEGYDVIGKTGTAEKPGRRGYDKKRLISSFVGAFPANDPHYVVYVVIDEPKGIKESWGYATAGWTAAPAAANVIKRMASVLGLPPNENKISDASQDLRVYISSEGQ